MLLHCECHAVVCDLARNRGVMESCFENLQSMLEATFITKTCKSNLSQYILMPHRGAVTIDNVERYEVQHAFVIIDYCNIHQSVQRLF